MPTFYNEKYCDKCGELVEDCVCDDNDEEIDEDDLE